MTDNLEYAISENDAFEILKILKTQNPILSEDTWKNIFMIFIKSEYPIHVLDVYEYLPKVKEEFPPDWAKATLSSIISSSENTNRTPLEAILASDILTDLEKTFLRFYIKK